MSKITPSDLGAAIAQELTSYHEAVIDGVDKAAEEATKKLVKLTKASAPVGARGSFKKNITSKRLRMDLNGSTYVWYVKPPDHRLTHLLVHGHATPTGGRTKSDPFLHNAISQVMPEYERHVEEVLRNG